MKQNPAIIVMCKAPLAGTVKTRLTPFLTVAQAADFAAALVRDMVSKALQISANVIIAFAPADEKKSLSTILPDNLIWTAQTGNDLGERMNAALEFAFARNFSPLIVIGTDSPTLPLEIIKDGLMTLSENRADVVLGAAEDGGYYLVGVNQPDSCIFANVEWSSARTFEQTADNISKLNLRLGVLPMWYDVDTPADLRRLAAEISIEKYSAAIAPRTADWLARHKKLFDVEN